MDYRRLTRFRRISQAFFLALFVVLVLRTEFRGSLRIAADEIHLPYPVAIFLQADPLAAITNALATHSLYRGLLWSLIVIIPTLFFGRFFCGWVCPLGTLHHACGAVRSEAKRGRRLLDSNRYKPWQSLKHYVLIGALAAALFGSAAFAGIFDPISLVARSLALSVLPAMHYAVNASLEALSGAGIMPLRFVADGLHVLLGATVLSFRQPYYRQAFVLGLILVTLLALNLRITRFWCRALCPLGALLGWMSRWSVVSLEKRASNCGECNRCLLHCQGGDEPIPGARWRKAECHFCFNCVADCPEAGIRFRLFAPQSDKNQGAVEGPELKGRRAATAAVLGAVMVPFLRGEARMTTPRNERLIRPPGSLEEKGFLERCIRCGECIKVCPNNALHPAFLQAGLEGLWTPVLVPRAGYCEPSCVLCGEVCPTGSIWQITANEKAWVPGGRAAAPSGPVHIGTAFYDRGRCLPWAMATECIVCEEWCPTSPKAVYLRPAEVADAAGKTKQVRQPYIDPNRCVGCGACEFACPVHDQPAVYVNSIGETRSRTNQVLLNGARRPV